MSFERFIGMRYLKAKRRQVFISIITAISICGLAVGVMALTVTLALVNGFQEDLQEKIIGTNSHLSLLQYGGTMDNHGKIMEKIKGAPGLVASTPFIFGQGMMTFRDRALGMMVKGVDVETAGAVTSIAGDMYKGELRDLVSLPPEGESSAPSLPKVLIGRELQRNYGIFIDDVITLISPFGGGLTPLGMIPQFQNFLVAGIFESGMYEYDTQLLFISLEDAQRFFDLGEGVTGIEIRVENIYKAKEVGEIVRKMAGGFPFWSQDWMERNKNLFSALKLEKVVMFIVILLITIVATFNIVTSLILMVMEKGKDIAVLKSMGATTGSIMKIFIINGGTIGVMGTVAGTLLGLGLCFIIDKYQFVKLDPNVYYISTIPVSMHLLDFMVVAFAALCFSFLATLYPAFQASRIAPAEALRYE